MLSRTLALGLLLLLVCSGCKQRSRRGVDGRLPQVFSLGDMVADPAADRVFVSDAHTGQVLAVTASTGTVEAVAQMEQGVGGLAVDPCGSHLFVSVPAALRIDVFAIPSLTKLREIRLTSRPQDLLIQDTDRLLAVTDGGLLEINLATHQPEMILAADKVEAGALLALHGNGNDLYIAQNQASRLQLSRFSLSQKQISAQSLPTVAFTGDVVALTFDGNGRNLLLATTGDDGLSLVDTTTGSVTTLPEIGGSLRALTINSTGTRVYFVRGGGEIESCNLHNFVASDSLDLLTGSRDKGLLMAADGQSLLQLQEDSLLRRFSAFESSLQAAPVARIGESYEVQIRGNPGDSFYVFGAAAAGYLFLEPELQPAARFLDLDLGSLFVLMVGQFDPQGDGARTFHLQFDPRLHGVDVILQAATLSGAGSLAGVTNPLLVQILPPNCGVASP